MLKNKKNNQEENQNVEEKIKNLACKMWENKEKVLFIIGAGASASAGIPTSNKIKEALLEIVSPEILKKVLLEAKIPIDRDTNIAELPLEMLLTAYAEFTGEERAVYHFLKSEIKEKEPLLYTPIGYEVLSHFVKHKIVRCIISLNFDELLEKALDSEVGEDGYEQIKSRSAFDKLKEEFDRLREEKKEDEIFKMGKPLLLKPHGTISIPLTLRPTWETVQRLEDEKKEVIKKVLDYASVIIIVGYSMKDRDIQSILLPFFVSHPEKTVYFVTKSNEVDNQIERLCERIGGCVIKNETSDDFFKELGDKLVEVAKDKGRFFSPISEHKIRTVIFKAIDGENKDKIEKIEDKLKIEILLVLVKTKGLIAEKYFGHHRRIKKCINELKTAYKERFNEPNRIRFLNEIIEDIKVDNNVLLVNVLETKEPGMRIYYIKTVKDKCKEKLKEECKKELEEECKKELIAECKNRLKSEFTNQILKFIERWTRDNDEIKKDIKRLLEQPDYDLGTTPEESFLFKNPEILFTREDFENKTKTEIVKQMNNAQEICVITETGEWINRMKNELRRTKIRIITSDPCSYPKNSFHKEWAEIQQIDLMAMGLPTEVRCVEFLTNKHHMTILKLSEQEKRAMYFNRELKNPEFVPIWLTDNVDIRILEEYFEDLWKREEPGH